MSDSWLERGLDMLKEHAGGSSSVVAPGQVRAEPSFNECVFATEVSSSDGTLCQTRANASQCLIASMDAQIFPLDGYLGHIIWRLHVLALPPTKTDQKILPRIRHAKYSAWDLGPRREDAGCSAGRLFSGNESVWPSSPQGL